ncbi:hypothetical protein O8H71_001012 [Enterobacter hormaechei]|uniref:hypothetical protein n=1 Tax=Enterobacter hormaechei TaxID=158836 RepID=UPI00058201C9|nr:hypothetical protein [Enterobacter hormaechei]AJB62280.1 hypothetical protein LI62_09470 [Enterobacter hormaechei subsp. steigerwaltii]KJO31069.1 hypothetical protein SS08_09545 [Enterobacter hormaechei subsp. steigerwaltii]
MFLVKSCHSDDNIFSRNTIKIGSLNEYRKTEKKEIADEGEGNISLRFDLHNFHMHPTLWRELRTFAHSENLLHINRSIQKGYSALIEDYRFFERIIANATLSKLNRYILCLSLLDSPRECSTIFNEYNDYWYFHSSKIKLFGETLAANILNEIKEKLKSGANLFNERVNISKLSVHWGAEQVKYTSRDIIIDNYKLYTQSNDILKYIRQSYMIKPLQFSHEKEFRFVFDIYNDETLLIPKESSLIIPATGITNFSMKK